MPRPTSLTIDLNAIRHNLLVIRALTGSKVMVCVKANAYGHGAYEVAGALDGQVDAFAVAVVEEAISLRRSGIQSPILVLQGFFDQVDLHGLIEHRCWAVVHSHRQLDMLADTPLSAPLPVWLKLNTGMNRLGFEKDDVPQVIEGLKPMANVSLKAVMSHFACADDLSSDLTSRQILHFDRSMAPYEIEQSLCNSAALMTRPDAHRDWVRPGLMVYGVSPLPNPHDAKGIHLRPAMSFTSSVIAVQTVSEGEGVSYGHAWRARRESRIAVVAAGYGDGYPRDLAEVTHAWIADTKVHVVGKVTMDMLFLDITDIPKAVIGTRVELWGTNLLLADVAKASGYSPYELMTRLPPRISRTHLELQ